MTAAPPDSITRICRDAASVVSSGQLAAVLRGLVNDAPGLSIGSAALFGYMLGAGIPPTLMTLAARATGRALLTTLLQQQLIAPRRNP